MGPAKGRIKGVKPILIPSELSIGKTMGQQFHSPVAKLQSDGNLGRFLRSVR